MIWVLFVIAFVVGLAMAAVGALYACDPEGRGAGQALLLGGAGALLIVGSVLGAASRGVWLLVKAIGSTP